MKRSLVLGLIEKLRLRRSQWPQTVEINQNLKLSKNCNKAVIPLPIKTETQTILLEKIKPKGEIIQTKYFKVLNHKAERARIVNLQYRIKTKPIKEKIAHSFFIKEYKNLKKIDPIFFQKNEFINPEDPEIRKIINKIARSENNLQKTIRSLYDWTLDYLEYANPIKGLYTYKQALMMRRVDCGGFCTLLLSLLIAKGIPSRLVVGHLIGKKNQLNMHVWIEVLLPDGKIFPLDPSIDWRRRKNLTKRWAGFGFVGSDRIVFSYGCGHKLSNKTFPLLQNPLFFS